MVPMLQTPISCLSTDSVVPLFCVLPNYHKEALRPNLPAQQSAHQMQIRRLNRRPAAANVCARCILKRAVQNLE
jgi:hypothetical protein